MNDRRPEIFPLASAPASRPQGARTVRLVTLSPCHLVIRFRAGVQTALAGAILLTLLVSSARAADETRPAPPPPPSRPMAEPYNILLVRSIFSRDHNRAAPLNRAYAAPTTQQALDPSSAAAQLAAEQAEANFVLKGVSFEDGVPAAFFEQTSAGQLLRVHAGEAISHGKLVNITLDGVDYSNGAATNRIAIGQALDGGISAPTTQPATTTTATVTDHPAGEKPSWWRRSK